ncbi:hypothetical protein [Motilimonas cestriensis]|uniref:hypothetical protein n=1 Tax=Motilimonas cestriensis TaxID=2742685 RepID=UPI003DA37000
MKSYIVFADLYGLTRAALKVDFKCNHLGRVVYNRVNFIFILFVVFFVPNLRATELGSCLLYYTRVPLIEELITKEACVRLGEELSEKRFGHLEFCYFNELVGATEKVYPFQIVYDLRTNEGGCYAIGEAYLWKAEVSCEFPYSWESSEQQCIKSCPPGRPLLDLTKSANSQWQGSGRCIAPDNKQPPLQCTAGNPVSISDGTKVQLEPPVYQGAGAFPLSFQYQYNGLRSPEAKALQQQSISAAADKAGWVKYVQPAGYTGLVNPPALTQLAADKVNGVRLGGFKSWSHNYQAQLTVLDDAESRVSLQSAAFESRQFIKQTDGSYRSRNLTSDTLSRVVDEQGSLVHWIYRSVDNQFEYYNAKGQLTRRVNKTGLSHYLEYDNHDQLALVRDDAGNQLQFSFDDKGKLLTVITPTQETISYGYDQYANLESVTKVLGTKTTERRYHYEDARHPYALTGITDENGVRYATWEYDEQGRAITSKHAGEVDKTTFAFEPLQTTVTNPLGKQTVYHYQNTAGTKRLSKVEGIASTNCLAANQHYTYYPNGQIETKTDWKGVVTRFEYNHRHLESKRIEAAGTPEQRVITTTWHPELNLPATVKVGNQVTTYDYHANGQLKSQHVTSVQ